MGGSIHIHGTASSIVDTVFVCRIGGITPSAWLFENPEQLAKLMAQELEELRKAGMKPTTGDTRCIAFGHITRMAVWRLRPDWNASLATTTKMNMIRAAMDALSTVDQVQQALESAGLDKTTDDSAGILKKNHKETIDAIAI